MPENQKPQPLRDLNSVDDLADYLRVHPQTVRRKIAQKRIEAKKVDGRVYITREAALAYVNGN